MSREQGFTIVELMISLGLLAILAAMALPSYERLVQRNAIEKFRDDLFGDLILARSEALTRGKAVTLCPSVDGATCSGNNSDWDRGWLMFGDLDADRNLDAGEELIQVYENGIDNPPVVDFNPTTTSVKFERLGNSPGNNGTFTFCQTRLNIRTGITLAASGRARYSQGDSNVC